MDINENYQIQENFDLKPQIPLPLKLKKEDSKNTHSAINFESEKDLLED